MEKEKGNGRLGIRDSRLISNLQSRISFIIIILALFALSACQGGAAEQVSAEAAALQPSSVPATDTAEPTPTIKPTVTPPATATEPKIMPSFNLVSKAAMAPTATAVLLTPTLTAVPATETPTTTPQPTFTPPALPQTSLEEHYWLKRPVAEGGIVWTDKEYPYGSTRGGQLRPHHGVEFNVPYDTEILAAASGTVVVAGPDDSVAYGPQTNFYGNLVVIQHDTAYQGQPVFTLYGHLNQVLVSEGQHVAVQEPIALSGASGVADGPHMHFEVRLGQNSYQSTHNPLLWLWPFPDRGTIVGRITFPNGSLAYEAPVRAVRVDAPSQYAATTTYADDSTNSDDLWQENFALDDIEAGYYEVIVYAGDEKYKENVWVYPRRTSFVEIVIGN